MKKNSFLNTLIIFSAIIIGFSLLGLSNVTINSMVDTSTYGLTVVVSIIIFIVAIILQIVDLVNKKNKSE